MRLPRNSVLVDGRRLKELRAKRNLTQEELAARIGYSDRLVRKLERGGPVSRKTLLDVATFYQSELDAGSAASQSTSLEIEHLIVSPICTPEQVLRKFFDHVITRRDLSNLEQSCVDGVQLVCGGRIVCGVKPIRTVLSQFLATLSDLPIIVETITSTDDSAVIHWQAEEAGSVLPSGAGCGGYGSTMVRVAAGKICEIRIHWDPSPSEQ